MQSENEISCLNCDGTSFTESKSRVKARFKNESIDVIAPVMVCDSCDTQLASTKQMNQLRLATADAYRIKHGLLTSQAIQQLRESLEMSQREFAEYLCVGEASVKRWESYFVQDSSQDQNIRLKCIQEAAEKNVSELAHRLERADNFSGELEFSQTRLDNATLYLLKSCRSPLFVNKALFYSDFVHYKRHGRSITGSKYAKLELGPCPNDWKDIFKRLRASGAIESDGKGHNLVVKLEPDMTIFSDSERTVLQEIKKLTSSRAACDKLLDLSHKEAGYLETDICELIPYSYSKKLLIK